ncbi:zinc-binding dehydrogenase, partial [Thermus sp.]|uniref:zinc-binding dehydrogenase n=1 Tax=Thermus sp. TaxID=275 RepID=UPI00307E2EA4
SSDLHRGGYKGVVEASGSGRGFREALALAEERGRVLLLGAPGVEWADLSPFWFKEVALLGSYTYTRGEFQQAVDLLKEVGGLEALVGGVFPLEAWPEALKAKGKALFRPNVA